jgi:hypothetical protein
MSDYLKEAIKADNAKAYRERQEYRLLLERFLLDGRIDLWDIPQELRITHLTYYRCGSRIYRQSADELYYKFLCLLVKDMKYALQLTPEDCNLKQDWASLLDVSYQFGEEKFHDNDIWNKLKDDIRELLS